MKKTLLIAALSLSLPVSAMAASFTSNSGIAGGAASADVGAKISAAFSTQSQAGNEFSFNSVNGNKFNLAATGTATNQFQPLSSGGFQNTSNFSNSFTGNTGGLNTYGGLQATFASGSASFNADVTANLKAAEFGVGAGSDFTKFTTAESN